MAKLYLTLFLALVLSHATARNIPTDEIISPSTANDASAPVQTSQNVATAGGTVPATNGAMNDEKNFISYGGVGGWGGVGGYVGVLPIIGGIGGMGGAGGLGGVGLGGVGGLGKVIGGGVGGIGGIGHGIMIP